MRYVNNLLAMAALATVAVGCDDVRQTAENKSPVADSVKVVASKRYGVDIAGYTLHDNVVKPSETMGRIMSDFGRSAVDVDLMDRAAADVFPLRKMRAGQPYTAFVAKDSTGTDRLDYIAYESSDINYVLFSMVGDSMSVKLGAKPVRLVRNRCSATITSSLWGAVMEANLPYALASEMEDIYQWSIDFFGIQRGDSFSVIYDERFVQDTISVGIGQIWGAKFTQSGKDYFAIPFQQGEKLEYWDEDGGSLRKQMLKAPLKYSRISSRFTNARFHPIYKIYRPHHGVDYAAPSGTPVHAVADGVVVFKGWGGGGGNSLKIQHPNDIMTGYLHLSRYADGIASGTRVSQGQLIGYVGSTGASTGPHLDYRVWRHGVAIDPLTIPQEPSEPISEGNKAAFEAVKAEVIAELNGEDNVIPNLVYDGDVR